MTILFSFAAEKIWRAMPKSNREAILSSVWCGQCRGNTTMVDYSVQSLGDEVILCGKCQTCGAQVRRVVD
ncbi:MULTISPECIES: hypothetical protein [Methylomonas]|uniref:hypothetical protein n=1 Tax=Methylomonas TaxID=416 RepID=UPI001232AE08|nr:hypothetical protein [Methylomonas rhizoryzae]